MKEYKKGYVDERVGIFTEKNCERFLKHFYLISLWNFLLGREEIIIILKKFLELWH